MNGIFKKDHVYEQLKAGILDGQYPKGSQLPHEKDFAKELGVGKVTLRSALDRLEEEMLIVRLRGKGTFIRDMDIVSPVNNVMLITSEEYMKVPNNPLFSLLPEFKKIADHLNYGEIHVTWEHVRSLNQHELADVVKRNKIKGIFLFSHVFSGKEPIINFLKSTGCPVILPYALQNDSIITGFAAVTVKMAESWKTAIKYLAGLEHRKIATITQQTSYSNYIMEMTMSELLQELSGHGINVSEDYIKFVSYKEDAVKKVVNNWLAMKEPPTAIMSVFPGFVPFIYSALREKRKKIPDDISVLSVSRQKEALILTPTLTDINANFNEIAAKAYKLLMDAPKWFPVAEGKNPPNLFHYYSLGERESTKKINSEELLFAAV